MHSKAQLFPRRGSKRQLLLLGLLLGALVALLARQMLWTGTLFLHLAVMDDSELAAHSAPVQVRELHVPLLDGRSVAVRLYLPSQRWARSTVLVKGMHVDGYDEARLVRFARRLAAMGHIVITPDIEDLRTIDVNARSVDDLVQVCQWAAIEKKRAMKQGGTDTRVGLLGVCYGGGLALAAASRPAMHDSLAWVCSVGGYGDLDRVRRYLVDGRLPDGSFLQPDEMGTAVVLRWGAERLFHPSEVALGRQALLDIIRGDAAAAQRRAALLSATTRWIPQMVLERRLHEAAGQVGQSLAPWRTADALSPERQPRPACSVFLLHGSSDNGMPATESQSLARWSGGRLCVTPALQHVSLKQDAASVPWLERLRLIRFWNVVLRL